MNRFILSCSLILILSLGIGSFAAALEGNSRKGKFLFRKNCRSCHGQTAGDLSPSSKTQAEWKAAFDNIETIPCKKDWAELSEQDIADIYSYAHGFAKDSPTPAKCE